MTRTQFVVYSVFIIGAVLIVGGLIAIIGMGQFRTDLNLMRMPQYFWFYRDNDFVMWWLARGIAGTGGVAAMIALYVWINRKGTLHGDARWATKQEAKRAHLLDHEGLLLGKMGRDLVQFGGTEHVLLEAPTRAGKGVGVVIPNLLTWPDSVVVLDVKQENWEKSAGWRRQLGHRVYLFDPLDTQGRTARYNPFAYINRHDPVEVVDELQKIAAMLWPPPTSGESFWADSARTAFIGVAAYIAATEELPFTMGEVYRNFSAGDAKERFPKIIKQREEAGNPLSVACVSALNDWISSSANTFTGIRQSVSAKINLWLNPYVDAATSESDFDLREFRTKPITLYLGVSPDNMERMADVYNLLFQQLIDQNVRELPKAARAPSTFARLIGKLTGKEAKGTPGTHPLKLLLLLDEFARLGRASVIAAGFSYVAGYGIRLMPVIQARGQLREVYGNDVTDEIVQNCGVELVFTPKANSVAKEISERLGNYDYAAQSRSKQTWDAFEGSVSTSQQRRALMLPQELLLMPEEDMIVLRAGIRPLKGKKLRYYQDKWMVDASNIAPPHVKSRPLDASIARRSLALIAAAEAVEMSDSEALDGPDASRIVTSATPDDLPSSGKPEDSAAFWIGMGFPPEVVAEVLAAGGFDAATVQNGEEGNIPEDGSETSTAGANPDASKTPAGASENHGTDNDKSASAEKSEGGNDPARSKTIDPSRSDDDDDLDFLGKED